MEILKFEDFLNSETEKGWGIRFLSPLTDEIFEEKTKISKYSDSNKNSEFQCKFVSPNTISYYDIGWLTEFCKKHNFGIFAYYERENGKPTLLPRTPDENPAFLHVYITEDPNERLLLDNVYGRLTTSRERIGKKKAKLSFELTAKNCPAKISLWKLEYECWHSKNFSTLSHYRETNGKLILSRPTSHKIIAALKLYFNLWKIEDFEILGFDNTKDDKEEETIEYALVML